MKAQPRLHGLGVRASGRCRTSCVQGIADLKSQFYISPLEASIHHDSNGEGGYFPGKLLTQIKDAKASSIQFVWTILGNHLFLLIQLKQALIDN